MPKGKPKELVELCQLFARCMSKRGSDEDAHRSLAAEFNARFEAFLDGNPEESVGTFAMRMAQLGVPYPVAFADLISVRGMKAAPRKRASPQGKAKGKAPVARGGASMPDAALRRSGRAPSAGPRAKPRVRWTLRFDERPTSAPVMVDGVLLVTLEGKVVGVDVTKGRASWRKAVTGRILASPAWAGDVVFAGDDAGYVRAFEVHTGKVRWTASTGRGPIYASPVVARGLVLVTTDRQGTVALDAATGAPVWSFKSGNGTSGATVVGERVYFASMGVLHVRDLATGKALAKVRLSEAGQTRTALVIEGGRAVVGTQKRGVVGLDLERLAVTWTHPCRNMVSDAPAFAGGRVFAGPQLDAFRALDGASGAELWRADEHAASSPRVAGSAVYVGTWFGLSCLDAATGKLLWKHSPGGRVLTPWVERGTVYAASERNTLVALAR